MIPSLVAGDLRTSIVEYLATTFALSEDDTYAKLTDFLLDKEEGIFRGPYLRVRLPFVEASDDADLGVRWTPPDFRPYAHQVAAWQRLAGRSRTPKPTLITTGTGSGKSEGFLVPIVDHCIAARERGQRGIKALILYPMNALVTDQERRIAAALTDPQATAAGVRAGVWIGDDQSLKARRDMGPTHLVSDASALMDDPPDILLTNYKMLDRLLTTPARQRLWAANTPPADREGWRQALTYLVLDEFHSYDGAQGTDVAMLLRRLGHRLGVATAATPLAGIAPVGTSATLGSSPSSGADMCRFAEKVFGVRFDASSIVGEQRQTVAQVCHDIDFALPVPAPADVAGLDPEDLDGLARAFTGEPFDDAQVVGRRLLRHHVTASLLRVAADRPRLWSDAVAGVAQYVQEWGRVLADEPATVAVALERFVALISQARGTTATGGTRALFSVEVQVWIREVTRLLRAVTKDPGFRWSDSPPEPDRATIDLPSVHCTSCGRSGWMALANRASGQGAAALERLVNDDPAGPYTAAVRDRERTRTMLRADPKEPDVLWLDPIGGQVFSVDEEDRRIAVLVGGMTGDDRTETSRDAAAEEQRCPSCGTKDAIRFIGSRVTTLAAVGITQMFGSPHVADDERKLLAFTDSVQDASHRAAFFSGRTHRFNLRATMSKAVQERGRLPLQDIAAIALGSADAQDRPADALFSLVPPDLLWEEDLIDAWAHPGTSGAAAARDAIALRLGFDAVLEAGLRSRFGRTLETTNTATPEISLTEDEWTRIVAFATETVRANAGTLFSTEPGDIRTWIEGLLQRLRLRGGIFHPFLDDYVKENGRRWLIWGGGHRLAPKFPKQISAPTFFTSSASDDFDAVAGAQTWVALWTKKVVGVTGPGADRAVRDVIDELVRIGVLEQRVSTKGLVWGLPPDRIAFVDVIPTSSGTFPPAEVRCDLCATRHHAAPDDLARWVGRPCLRLRCTGLYAASSNLPTNYYRGLYREGRIRRVVAAEHTGLLDRKHREAVETGFKDGGGPEAPNVLAATPTLEMGIDIGDLSAVMLTAVPPTQSNYVQRVGRAGRRTGNSFVTTFAEGDPRSLYFLQDPELMIAGEITAPNCYLDAIEILRRQYLAFLVDRAAEGPSGPLPAAGEMPRTIGQTATSGMQPGGWMRVILEAGTGEGMVTAFVRLFGVHLDPAVARRLKDWAATDMTPHVERVIDRWHAQLKTLTNQRERLRDREKALKEKPSQTPDDQAALGRVVFELRYLSRRLKQAREAVTLNELEALGLMPNYTLFDDSVTLEVSLWSPNPEHDENDKKSRRFISEGGEYVRPASRAIRELAPGNWFYVNAHRVRIDAVDNGTEHEPSHQRWRLCPECSWATIDAAEKFTKCPRCGSLGVADQGATLNVLPLRIVSSTEREATARVGDESDDRDREFHDVRTQVDIDTEDISAAWMHTDPDTVFGVETARAATIRFLNLGPGQSHQPRALRIGGVDGQVGLFHVCAHCGGVMGIRGDRRDPSDKDHHRTWCKVRSGARKERWEPLALVHELVTEAVRILLPVAEYEHAERVASFKAALMLGLRDSFGGDPSHLRVLESDFPARGGSPEDRNRFVVLHDTVPGGTGYLPRLADPAALQRILSRARDLITTCECQTRGKAGCHRCLYGGIERHELPVVSRDVALELLDEILVKWNLEPAPEGTITGVNLTPVVQSELERMFKALLLRWVDHAPAQVTARPDPEHAARTRFEVRFQDGPHWEIQEQVNLSAHQTVPDFYATRVDAAGTPPMAIYLDGWEYHGKDSAQIDWDAARRTSLRESEIGVWTMTWHDVKAAFDAAKTNGKVGAVTPVAMPARNKASTAIVKQLGEEHSLANVLKLGAFEQLMAFLRAPEAAGWHAVATGLALGPIHNGIVLDVPSVELAVHQAVLHGAPEASPVPCEAKAIMWESAGGLRGHSILDPRADAGRTCTTVLALDTSAPVAQDEWADWMHLGNLLTGLRDQSIVTTTNSFVPDESEASSAVAEPTATGASIAGLGIESALEDCFDAAAKALAIAAAAVTYDDFVVGFEPGWADGTVVEVAWPTRKVGILAAGADHPEDAHGWAIRPSDEWDPQNLIAALEPKAV
ncbi:DEAD/DEAH box helicase [Patulibacter sp. NPDC049589]|uniref:DEAD/DEAH box helicase n=1 Tax=Patulibacter sp. NPDC049589 TaxID=3154731 RepID=UPI003427706E